MREHLSVCMERGRERESKREREGCQSCLFELLMDLFTCFNFLKKNKNKMLQNVLFINVVVFDCLNDGLVILFQLISQVRG